MLHFRQPARERREDGFTLIELLVVILIIGILSAIAVPAFLNQRKSAGEASVKSDLANAAKTFETELISKKTYPITVPSTVTKSDGVSLAVKGLPASAPIDFSQPPNPATDTPIAIRAIDSGQTYTIYGRVIPDAYYQISTQAVGLPKNYVLRFDATIICSGRTMNLNGQQITISAGTGWGSTGGTQTCTQSGDILESFTIKASGTVQEATVIAPVTMTTPVKGGTDGFCIEGRHSSDNANVWKYDSRNGGIKKGIC